MSQTRLPCPLTWDDFAKEPQDRIRELFLGGVVSVVRYLLVHHGP
jgi:hypothetical protein